jgi:hypothetical protein
LLLGQLKLIPPVLVGSLALIHIWPASSRLLPVLATITLIAASRSTAVSVSLPWEKSLLISLKRSRFDPRVGWGVLGGILINCIFGFRLKILGLQLCLPVWRKVRRLSLQIREIDSLRGVCYHRSCRCNPLPGNVED